MKSIITISREFGSGGRTVGRLVAERLGYAFYDHELVNEVARRCGFSPRFIEENGEYANARSSLLFSLATAAQTPDMLSMYDRLYIEQMKFIEELAEKGNCVIVGRCADYILAGRDNTINVFVYAPREVRVNRIMARHNLSEAEALKAISTSDKERGNHYFRYTDQKWGKAQNYDVCINSGLMGIEKTAEMLADMAKIEVRA